VLTRSARTLAAGDLEAVFLPEAGMLGASLRHRGRELLGRLDDLAGAARAGSTAGLPFLYPWANRLSGFAYEIAGRRVELDPASPMLHLDAAGLPIHGVPWSCLAYAVVAERDDALGARLEWVGRDLLSVFPFPHLVELDVALDAGGLSLDATITPTSELAVPVSFGFHPYLVLPGLPRRDWLLELPARERLVLDERGIPTGGREPAPPFAEAIGERTFDDGFALPAGAVLALEGGGTRIEVSLGEGYRYGQVFVAAGAETVALEPMTAPTNALVSGRDLALVPPGGRFEASFRLAVAA
jgi:aldose 1-epimerase